MEVWYLQMGAQRKGPFSSAGLREALRLGEVDPFCDVFHASNPDLVKPLLEWDEIFEATSASSSTPQDPDGSVGARSKESSKKILKVLGSTEQSEKNGLRKSDNLINQTFDTLNFSIDHLTATENTSLSEPKHAQSREKGLSNKASQKNDKVRIQDPSASAKLQNSDPNTPVVNVKNHLPSLPTKDMSASHAELNSTQEGTVKRKRKCIYLVQQAGRKYGPFTSFEVFEQFKNGSLKPGALVGKGSLAKTVPIERFVEVYQSGKKTNFFPVKSDLTKWFTPRRLSAILVSSAIVMIAVFYTLSSNRLPGKIPKLLAKTRPETQTVVATEQPSRASKAPTTTNPSLTSNSQTRPLEPLNRNIDNHRRQNRLSTNPRPTGSSRMSAKSYPSMIKVAGTSAIAQALMGKIDGSEVTIAGLEFDRAAVRNCRGMCEVIFIDSSGAAIQVVFDGASHRNSLFSKSGRASIVGFLTAGKQKVILKRVY